MQFIKLQFLAREWFIYLFIYFARDHHNSLHHTCSTRFFLLPNEAYLKAICFKTCASLTSIVVAAAIDGCDHRRKFYIFLFSVEVDAEIGLLVFLLLSCQISSLKVNWKCPSMPLNSTYVLEFLKPGRNFTV